MQALTVRPFPPATPRSSLRRPLSHPGLRHVHQIAVESGITHSVIRCTPHHVGTHRHYLHRNNTGTVPPFHMLRWSHQTLFRSAAVIYACTYPSSPYHPAERALRAFVRSPYRKSFSGPDGVNRSSWNRTAPSPNFQQFRVWRTH